ncbi:TcdA/TcdB pore-forming domain-containing protein [Pseudomonas sp. MRSN 12121]|uniref:TcdA/TcdB pore-forming domain-containing protein n=1 Tax=Pseudomonas sp. MRSN 12121 TaxID=1611770 RepID=UPI0005BEB822|nr:TcdA/TcdB pore-forming domain-containing protein [Pseudomonas sp. MRSN 12121]AJO79288.1 cytotoxin [Pseudomonas sp. MRSN 12121]
MAFMSKDFTRLLNTLINQRIEGSGRQTEWFHMTSGERAEYVRQVGERLLDMQQSTLSVLAAQHFQMQDNPVSVGDQLQVLKQRRKQMNSIADTPATSAYKQQLDRDILLYSRQQTAITHYDSTWNKALRLLEAQGLKDGTSVKQKELKARVERLERQLSLQVADSTFTQSYVTLFSELQAYKEVSARYDSLLKAPAAQEGAARAALAKPPRASDELPVNISLLMMEERPGYIRMNVALVNASTDGRFKDFFLENGRLVVPTDGVLNFFFGTAARSLAWQQQYRLKSEPPSSRSPTFAPIRSVLVKTAFVEQYFAHHLVSESTLREGFKAQVLGNGHKLLLTNVDRKVPNQVGIQVSGQAPTTTAPREVPLAGALSDLINQNADIASFQTIGLEDFHRNSYHPDRDGLFVDIHELERSVGFAERQYLLEMPEGKEFRSATPFAVMTVDGDKVSSSHLSRVQTKALYQYSAAFFDKLEQLREGGDKARRLFKTDSERDTFMQQLARLLERNHITPAGVLVPEHSRSSLRDIKGNNLNKVLWEQAFAASAWQSHDNDALLFDLANRLANEPALARALNGGYVQSDIAQAKLLLAPAYEPWRAQAIDAEHQRVAAAKAAQHPNNPNVPVFDQVAVERSLDDKLFNLLLRGADSLQGGDAALRPTVAALLASDAGRSLRKQALFHALRPVADSLSKAAVPVNPHAALAPQGAADKVMINNRLNRPDPYLILNTHPGQAQAEGDAVYRIEDDKYRSYNQFRPDPGNEATRYMNDLDTPFVGGISGTTQTVSNALPELFGGPLSVKQYWQFQMANAAFMIRNGYHSFFETLYVAARYEPRGEGSIGAELLQMFDRYRAEGRQQLLEGELYDGVMARVLPLVNQGLAPAEEFHPPRFTRIGPLPALLGQAAQDQQLKSGLASLGGGAEPRQGSADIHQFAADPVQFAKTHTLSAEALVKSGRLPAEGHAQLVKVGTNLYELEYTGRGAQGGAGGDSVPAYFLGYNGPNQANAAPAYVDIPKHAAAGSFLFTGTLSGCSLVVTSLDANTFRVYHDGRVNSSLLYDNVVMAVDYKDYQVAGTAEGLAAAYMQYLDGQWQLVFQRQEYQRDGQTVWPKLREGAQPLQIQTADPRVTERNRAAFAAYREQVHQNLKKVATQFGVPVEGVADGVYNGGAFSPEHPAIAAWNRLREEVQAKVSADIQQLTDKRFRLQDERRGASDKGLIDQQIRQINLTQDHYRAQYDPVLREAGSVEKTWLWQQIKAKDGTAAVVRTDDSAIQGGGEERTSSVGERYAVAEAYQRGARGTAFSDGMRDFRTIGIPAVDDRMSSLEMKQLFLDGQLTPLQRGALSARITQAAQAEYIDKVLRQTAVFSEDFQRAGSVYGQLAPQDFYLQLVGDHYGGRCYPLVRAMAVALASGGERGVNSLVQKLFLASADPQAGSSTLLKNSLIRLHSNVDAIQASKEVGRVQLADVVARLAKISGTSMFALNTQNHSMLVGSTVTAGGGQRYYFYDPNVGIFAFDSSKGLAKAMEQHLVSRKLAAHYGSFGSQSAPAFNLIEIDTGRMAQVPVGNGLNVADLSRPEELTQVIGQQREAERVVDAGRRASEDLRLGTALSTFDAEQWGERFLAASTRLAREHRLGSEWMPVIATTDERQGGGYRVQFINRDQPEQTRWLETGDEAFVGFRRFVDEHMSVLNRHFSLEHGQIRPRAGVGEAAPVDGLNAGFAVQTLIQWFADRNRKDASQGTVSPDLATALKIHSYLGLAQMAHGTVQDVAKVTALVKTALRGEVVAAETSLKDFASSLGHTVNEGAGVLFGGAMVILDAYELAHADNDVQKAVYGTQLAFDSASFVTGAAGVGAGLLGASTAGAVLGGAGVILGGLAVGFTALAQAFGAVAEDAKAVGRYFDALDKAYQGNGYRYDAEKKVLVPLPGAVVKRLDLRNQQIGFDSQYIYRTHHGSTGSGAINYFFWAGDFPRMIHKRDEAIEVRSGIGYPQASQALAHGDSTTVILPGTPKSYISYEYMILPGSTTRHDTGFDVIRRLEEDRRFDYDFYIFPSEETIRRIRQEYVDTPVEVILDSRNRQLIVPELPKELRGYLRYEIKGAGGEYLIGLNEGARVKLSSENSVAADPQVHLPDIHPLEGQPQDVRYSVASNTRSRWIIDTSQLASDHISFASNRLEIGGVTVELDPTQNGRVLVVNGQGEVREVDFANRTAQVIVEDASQWQVPGHRIEQHLSELAKAHQLHGQYVAVENYTYEGRNVGQAFYEVAKNRMLFTDTQVEQARHAQLGAVVGAHAYFVDAENAAAWRVDIATGKVDAQFAPAFNQSAGHISRFWQEGDTVYLARRYQLKEHEAELTYRIGADGMELVGVVGDEVLLQSSARTGQHGDTLKTLLQGYESQATGRATPVYSLGAPMMEPKAAALVTVFGVDNANVAHRYWVRTSDGTLIKPNLAPPTGQQPAVDAQGKPRSAWPIPPDLVFAGSMPQRAGQEVFFFYSQREKVLFRQEGPGQQVLDGSQPSALRLDIPALANVLELGGHLVAVTEDGRVARIEASGRLSYEAVNEHWLKKHGAWWKDLASVTGSNATLAVFGAKAADGKSALPVWYHKGQVVVASPELQGKSLQFLGFDSASSSARLFEPASRKLYLQAPLPAEALATAFGTDEVLEATAQLPAATPLMPELQLQSAVQVDAGLRLTTVQGEILLRTNSGDVQLVAVNKGWQQARLGNLPQALAEVAGRWGTQGVLTLQGTDTLGWFDVASGQVFASTGIPAAGGLRFIGVASAAQPSAYVYSPTEQALYQVGEGAAHKLGHYGNVERIGASLLLQGGGADNRQDELAPPLIAGVDSVVLHGGAAGDTYRLSAATWAHYRTVMIDNADPGQALDRLIMPAIDGQDLLVSRQGEDVLLTDTGTGTALVLRHVLGEQAAAQGHLQIELPGDSSVIGIEHLLEGFAQAGSTRDGVFELASRERRAIPETNAIASAMEAEGPSLAKLSGAMAAFADTGGAREHLPQNRQAAQAVLVPPLS